MNDNRGLSFGKKQTTANGPDFANNRAYVIGVNAYSRGIPPLRTAVADADRLGQLLQESHGYQVRSFPRDGTPSLATLRKLLLETMPQEVGPDDRVLFYFAGHGIALDGEVGPEGYLVPEDAKREDRTSFLAMTELHDALAKLHCRHLLLILDCCFAGAFRWSSTRDLSALPSVIHRERFERYIQDAAWQVLTSAAHDQTALDVLSGNAIGERVESDKHSPFAAALFRALDGEADLIPRGKEGLSGGDGVITATELYLYLRQCVETATVEHRTRQTPELWPLKKHDKGEYILLTPGHELNLPPAPLLDEMNNPYRGLQSYDEEHAALFFGRSKFVTSLGERVQVQPLTIILGASGTGKSSIVKAGLLPFLRSREPDAWRILPPLRPGNWPLAALAALTLPHESGEPDAIADRLDFARSDPDSLARRVAGWAATIPAATVPLPRLVIVVDQFEELLTLCGNADERELFLRQIDSTLAAWPDRVRILLTLRSDFEPQFASSRLQQVWLAARVVVPVMTLDEFREAIEGPAALKVLYFQGRTSSQAFIDRLMGDVANTPGALSLLSFTLSELYRRYLARQADDRALLEEDYETLGGVGGSLRNRADDLYTGLPDDSHRATMRRIMVRMVSVEGGELARRRVPEEELVYESPEENLRVQEVVCRLTEARLVVVGKETDGQPYIEPAHDELVRGWDKLLRWSREGQETYQLRRLLTPEASDWKQGRGGLWHANPRLNLVRKDLDSEDRWLNRHEAEFVRASVARRRKIWISAVSAVAAAFLILAVITVFALVQRRQANQRRIESIQETVRLLKIEGEQAQADGHLQSAMHYYAASLERRAEVLETDPVSRLRIGVLSAKAPVIRAIIDCPQRPERVELGLGARRLLTYSDVGRHGNIPTASVRLWDGRTGTMIAELKDDQQHGVQVAQFSSNGRFLLVLFCFDNRVSLWDAEQGKLLRYFEGHEGVVNDAAFCPDERTVATSSRDGTARIWEAATGRELRSLPARDGAVFETRFSPDGRRIATTCQHEIRIWDAATGELLQNLDVEGTATNVEFSPDGKQIVSASRVPPKIASFVAEDYRAMLWDVESGQRLCAFSGVGKVGFVSPAGRFFTSRARGTWQRVFRDEVQLYKQDGGNIEHLAWYEGRVIAAAPDRDYFLMTNDDVLRVLDTDDGSVRRILVGASMAKVHPAGRLLLTDYSDNTARLWDVRAGKWLAALEGHLAPIQDVDFDSSGNWIATASADDTVRIWQYEPADEQDLVGHSGGVTQARFLDGNPQALTVSWKPRSTFNDSPVDGDVRFWDLMTGRPVARVEFLGPTTLGSKMSVACDPANRVVLIGYLWPVGSKAKSAVRIVDSTEGRQIALLDDQLLRAYSPRHQLVFTDNSDGVIAWNMRNGERRFSVTGRLSADMPQLITGERFATIVHDPDSPQHDYIQIWDTATGRFLQRINYHPRAPYMSYSRDKMLFHPNGELIMLLGHDTSTIRLFNLLTAKVTGTLHVSPDENKSGEQGDSSPGVAKFNSDGRFLITGLNPSSIWHSVTGQRVKELVGVYCDDNGATSHLITLGDGQVYVWNMKDWSQTMIVRSAEGRITAARLSRDGRRLITGSDAGTVELWGLETGTNLIRLGLLDASISVVASDAQGLRVLAGSDTGELKVWTVMPELLPTQELAAWIAATAGTGLREDSEQVTGLASGDWASRRDAVIGRLDALLKSGDLQERVPVASAILRLSQQHPAAIETLMEALETTDATLVARAQAALSLADPASDEFRRGRGIPGGEGAF